MKIPVLLSLFILSLVACQKEAGISPKSYHPVIPGSTSSTPIAASKPDTIPDKGSFKLELLKDSINNDETMFIFNHNSSTDFSNAEDSPYFPGFGAESLSSISKDGRDLVINSLPYTSGMSIDLDVDTKADGAYIFKLSYINKIPSGIRIWVKDTYLKDSTDIRTNYYKFNVVRSEANSLGSKRFKLILKD